MPRSKRAKVVHLSKTTKKGKELTLKLYASIQECIPKYPYIYVFRVDNMRNTYLKDVRSDLSDSRLFFGKTKVMAVSLGLTKESEAYSNTSLLSPHLHGNVGLLFSPRALHEILEYFENFHPADYARSGTIAPRTFTIPAGAVFSRGGEIPVEEDLPLAHSIEPTLRKLGVPTRLVKGRIELENESTVCKEGENLGSGQTSLLKIFGVAMAEFKVKIVAVYDGEKESVTVVTGDDDENGATQADDVVGMEVDEFAGFEA